MLLICENKNLLAKRAVKPKLLIVGLREPSPLDAPAAGLVQGTCDTIAKENPPVKIAYVRAVKLQNLESF